MTKRSNKIYPVACVLIMIVMLISGCSGREKAKDIHIPQTVVDMEGFSLSNVVSMNVYKGTVYLLDDNNLHLYDFNENNMHTLDSISGDSVCVDEDYIYVCDMESSRLSIYQRETTTFEIEYNIDLISAQSEQGIKRMLACNNEIVVESLYLNDDGYTESRLFAINSKDGSIRDFTDTFKGNDSYSLIKSIDCKSDHEIVIVSVANTSWVNAILKTYVYDLKTQRVAEEQILDLQISDCGYDFNDDCLYFTSSSRNSIRKYSMQEKSTQIVTIFGEGELGSTEYIDFFVCEGNNGYIYKNAEKILAVGDLYESEEQLKIITRKGVAERIDITQLIEQYETIYGLPIAVQYYDDAIFFDTLNTKLLAHDTDYDLILFDGMTETGIISRIKQYDLYLPLNDIDDAWETVYDGIYDLVQDDGAIWCVPYSMSNSNILICNDEFSKNDLEIPAFDWTLDDVWELCEYAMDKDNLSVFSDPYMTIRIITNCVQDQINEDTIDEETLALILEKIKTYNDKGVLFDIDFNSNSSRGHNVLIQYGPQFFDRWVLGSDLPEYSDIGVINFPAATGVYMELDGAVVVNKYTLRETSAINFAKLMLNKDNVYSTGLGGIYKFFYMGKDIEKNKGYNNWGDDQKKYFSLLEDIYSHTGIYTYNYYDFMTYFREELLNSFYSGDLSPDQTAKAIVNYIEYTYFE
ncbi:MAG: carbohydrate ABC transporter substrate-binding protein [Clostridiales bacterium]|nr:carbohydrate ABC transporter substrate-binding protein [Clostridiales bacterium]